MSFTISKSNTAIKTVRLAALAASLAAALALQPALAQDKTSAPPPASAGVEHGPHDEGHRDPAAHLQRKLDDLGTKLHLKDSQQTAWKTYRSQIAELGAARHKHMEEGGPEQREQFKNLPAPERLQKAADRMRVGAEQLDKLAKQTGAFYKTLTPEQQTIFDLYQRDMKPHRTLGHYHG